MDEGTGSSAGGVFVRGGIYYISRRRNVTCGGWDHLAKCVPAVRMKSTVRSTATLVMTILLGWQSLKYIC